ncbi:MAG: P22AR C-terminal domain-containing protein [Burkholderiales bacterium]|nr:P22AR C-terminal domain-containing protein [Burkholderiales bacterium]
MSDPTQAQYEALWPRSPRQAKVKALARRLDTLEGKTIAWMWDYLFRGDEIFAHLEENLKARYPGMTFVSWREFGNTHGSDEREVVAALPQKLKALGVDAVVSGMGC